MLDHLLGKPRLVGHLLDLVLIGRIVYVEILSEDSELVICDAGSWPLVLLLLQHGWGELLLIKLCKIRGQPCLYR